MTAGRRASVVALVAVLADLVCVVAFATAGRASHEPGEAVSVVLTIAWPFAVAALGSHTVLLLRGCPTVSLRGGAVVVAATFVVGMALRALSGRGLAPAFLVVALLSLAVLMLGWRAVVALVRRRRESRVA